MFKWLFLVRTLYWLTDKVDVDASHLIVKVSFLVWGKDHQKGDFIPVSPVVFGSKSVSLTCIYSLMMSVKCSHECLKKQMRDQMMMMMTMS